jgi:cation diffusion facilitator family transporter
MSDCGCQVEEPNTAVDRRALWIALALNATMAVVESASGLYADSTGLLADALDMLADAFAYGIALFAIGRSSSFKAGAAQLSGTLLLVLGIGVLLDVARRVLYGSEPEGAWMIGVAALALCVNIVVLRLLTPLRQGEVHIRAAWLFTRADVVANAGVILSGLLVLFVGLGYADLVVGAAIGLYVIKEALEILSEAREAKGTQ